MPRGLSLPGWGFIRRISIAHNTCAANQGILSTVCNWDRAGVTSGLQGPARAAFTEGYGPVSEIESGLDHPLSTLHGLLTASRRENVPGWARPLYEEVRSGVLEGSIRAALD